MQELLDGYIFEWRGLGQARYRTAGKMAIQAAMTALVLNYKRLVQLANHLAEVYPDIGEYDVG